MTAIADLVSHLLSAGLPPDALARAVDLAQQHAHESADIRRPSADRPQTNDDQAERRRAADRERAQEAREAKKRAAEKSAESADRPQTKTQVVENIEEKKLTPDSGALTYLLTSFSDSQGKKEEVVGRARRGRGHVCPDDMRPSEVHFVAGQRESMSRQRVEACCDAMKSWSKANSNRAIALKVDWSAALFGWIGTEAERARKTNGHGTRTISTAADDLIARAEAAERGDDFGAIDVEFHRVKSG